MKYYYLNTVKSYLYENHIIVNKKNFSDKVNQATIKNMFDTVYFYGDSFFLSQDQIKFIIKHCKDDFAKDVDIDLIPHFKVQTVLDNLKEVPSSQLDLTVSTRKNHESMKYLPPHQIIENRNRFYEKSLGLVVENLGKILCNSIVSIDLEYDICRDFPISELGLCVFNHSVDNFKNQHYIINCQKSRAKDFEHGESKIINEEEFKTIFSSFLENHQNSIIVGHAMHNDINLLSKIYPEYEDKLNKMIQIDTSNIFRWINGSNQDPSLKDFLKHMKIGFSSGSLHNAGNDAYLAMKGFVKFFNDWQDIYDFVNEDNKKLLKKMNTPHIKRSMLKQ